MLSKAREEEKSDSDDCENSASIDSAWKKTVFELEFVLLHYTLEGRNMMSSTISQKVHHLTVREEAVPFCRKLWSHEDLLSHVS